MKKFLLAMGVLALMAGCASNAPAPDVKVDDKSTGGTTQPGNPPDVGKKTDDNINGKKNDDAALKTGLLAQRSVYFDYDKDNIKPEFTALVQAHANFLAQNRNRKVKLEGNADERGSREYNIALGQRRANAVKQALTVLGVAGDRIETISFGEDKPKALGHDEASWSQNRRVDIKYDGE
jgi:peptidoglycan-associated lipoprotein